MKKVTIIGPDDLAVLIKEYSNTNTFVFDIVREAGKICHSRQEYSYVDFDKLTSNPKYGETYLFSVFYKNVQIDRETKLCDYREENIEIRIATASRDKFEIHDGSEVMYVPAQCIISKGDVFYLQRPINPVLRALRELYCTLKIICTNSFFSATFSTFLFVLFSSPRIRAVVITLLLFKLLSVLYMSSIRKHFFSLTENLTKRKALPKTSLRKHMFLFFCSIIVD